MLGSQVEAWKQIHSCQSSCAPNKPYFSFKTRKVVAGTLTNFLIQVPLVSFRYVKQPSEKTLKCVGVRGVVLKCFFIASAHVMSGRWTKLWDQGCFMVKWNSSCPAGRHIALNVYKFVFIFWFHQCYIETFGCLFFHGHYALRIEDLRKEAQ